MQSLSTTSTWRNALHAFLHEGGHRGMEWNRLPNYAPFVMLFFCGSAYGAVMASYNGIFGERAVMILYGALKVPLLFVATMLIAIPFFYVLNLLAGTGNDFVVVWRGLVDYQLSIAVQLLALAPVTLFMNVITGDYRSMPMWSTLLFAAVSWNARRSLNTCYAPLIAINRTHLQLRRVWFILYAFVGIQMGWDLRPFVGHPNMPVQFFRDDIGNAYVEVAKLLNLYLQDMLRGMARAF